MDASRSNSPSRKSRFRAQGTPTPRPLSPAEEPNPETGEDADPYVQEETLQHEPSTDAPVHGEHYADEPPLLSYSDETPQAGAFPEDDHLPAGLRLTRSTERSTAHAPARSIWPVVVASVLCLGLGGAGGYFSTRENPKPPPRPAVSSLRPARTRPSR